MIKILIQAEGPPWWKTMQIFTLFVETEYESREKDELSPKFNWTENIKGREMNVKWLGELGNCFRRRVSVRRQTDYISKALRGTEEKYITIQKGKRKFQYLNTKRCQMDTGTACQLAN